MNGGHVARRNIGRLFPGVDPQLRHQRQPSVAGRRSLGCRILPALRHQGKHRIVVHVRGFFSRLPDLKVVRFFQERMMRFDPMTRPGVQSVLCYFLNNGHNHPRFTEKVNKASTGGICYTSDVVWTVPRAPVLPAIFDASGRGDISVHTA